MRVSSIVKPSLFIYECLRIVFLFLVLVFQLSRLDAVLWLSFTANGVLFPLMALFLWLDISGYRPYLSLFIAGKCIGIFSLLGWSIIFSRVTMIESFSKIFIILELVLISGDLLALAAVLFLSWDRGTAEKRLAQTQDALSENTEDK